MAERSPRATLALFVVSAAILFDALDLSITQVALPSIQSDLKVGAGSLPWVANAYVLTYGGFLLLGGRASDLLGRRRGVVSGVGVFGGVVLGFGVGAGAGAVVVGRGPAGG